MILIPSYLAPSAIHGIGLFAGRPVKKGEPVWDTAWELSLPHGIARELPESLRHYVYLNRGMWRLLLGDDRFLNHADAPNTGASGHNPELGVALRDIADGEELTVDYRTFDEKPL